MINQSLFFHNRLELLARWTSFLLSPLLLWPALFWLVLGKSQLSTTERTIGGLIIFGVGIVPSILTLIYLKKRQLISDWDLHRRSERYRFNLIVLVWSLVMLSLLYFFKFSILLKLGVVGFLWFALFTLITFFWKISAHTSSITLVFLLAADLTGTKWWGIPLIFLVSWARVYRKNHTLPQAVGGILLACLVYIIIKKVSLI